MKPNRGFKNVMKSMETDAGQRYTVDKWKNEGLLLLSTLYWNEYLRGENGYGGLPLNTHKTISNGLNHDWNLKDQTLKLLENT